MVRGGSALLLRKNQKKGVGEEGIGDKLSWLGVELNGSWYQ
jgi:hypothetical protein